MTEARRTPQRQRPVRRAAPARGFALVLCLWAVVIVLLLAAALDRYVGARVAQAQAIRARVQDELDAYSTRHTLLYLLATQRCTLAGLSTQATELAPGPAGGNESVDLDTTPVGGEIALDGSAYRGLGRIRFALQDEAGLVTLNSDAQGPLRALLASFGAEDAESVRLLDALADYRDRNSLSRVNGAEAEQYAAAGEPAPANRPLLTAAEIARVLGWREWLAAHRGLRVHDWLSVSTSPGFNPNVVPAELLARIVPGLDPAAATQLLDTRRTAPFRNLPDFNARFDQPLALEDDQLQFFPTANRLQLRLWRAGARQATLITLALTPQGREGPWQVRSIYRVSQDSQDEAHEVASYLFGSGAPSDF